MTINTDVVVIGTGPVGLFQIFELGLLNIRAHVIESLDKPGGQCAELYPDKPIYDIPALPVIGAQQLIDNLMQQAKPFDPVFHFGQQVIRLEKRDENEFYLLTSAGQTFIAKSVIIAGGVGAFEPVKLKIPNVERYLGSQIHYSIEDPTAFDGKDLVVLGGGDSALDWALSLRETASSVLLIHCSEKFKAAPASVEKMRTLCKNYEMQFLSGNVTQLLSNESNMNGIEVTSLDGVKRRVELDELLVFFGLSPRLGPIKDWGIDLHRNQLKVDTEKFQTSVEGLYAIGDINCYPGKKKLILSGFHEAALAAFAVKAQLEPEKKVALQYTTTSSVMHERLGVSSPYADDEAAA
ncbi:MAG: NAD(P)/FAD-dependent oxidoreductase [Granulosicoccaceae bacterium]